MRLLQTRKGMRIRQRGVVLVMALILLVIVSLVGAMAIRSAISGEQVSKSFRSNAMASQAAETALRYCEDQVLRSTGAVIVNPLPVSGGGAELWKTRSNWASSAKAIRIPAEV
ncbi:MAG TPA: PilX N-terminal domain-containing pilus assembly protein, partial [Burkholderiaceae bacterium]|nr:PilX N-terminal domain-containing pilus assembly protein [Burkholderiaceae bacterium]